MFMPCPKYDASVPGKLLAGLLPAGRRERDGDERRRRYLGQGPGQAGGPGSETRRGDRSVDGG